MQNQNQILSKQVKLKAFTTAQSDVKINGLRLSIVN